MYVKAIMKYPPNWCSGLTMLRVSKDVEQREHLDTPGGSQTGPPLETSLALSIKLRVHMPSDPSVLLLGTDLSTTDIVGQIILYCSGAVLSIVGYRTSSLYPQDSPSCDKQKCL